MRVLIGLNLFASPRYHPFQEELIMSVKSSIKETAGAAEEELGEALHNDKMAEKGRRMRNEGRVGNGKMPKVTKVGSEKP